MNTLKTSMAAEATAPTVRTGNWRSPDFEDRVDRLFSQFKQGVYKRTDRLFAALLVAEWISGIFAAWVLSPKTWVGTTSTIHMHVLSALFLGAIVIFLPVLFALRFPGRVATRHVVAIGQMLMSALLIHVSGGRVETHFHIFGSLAFLAFYYDWKVLITASIVTAIDHIVRGYYWPQSIYGTQVVDSWRWVEHTAWVVFQDIFLVYSCIVNTREMKVRARKEIEIETSRDLVEEEVKERTSDLKESENRLSAQFAVTSCLNRGGSLEDTANAVLESISEHLVTGIKFAAFWAVNKDTQQMYCAATWSAPEHGSGADKSARFSRLKRTGADLPSMKFADGRIRQIDNLSQNRDVRSAIARECGLNSVVAFPLAADEHVSGAIELYFSESSAIDHETILVLASLGRQIGQYVTRRQAEEENKRLAAVVRSSVEAIIGVAEDQTINSWNEGAQRLYGLSANEVRGKNIAHVVNGETPDEISGLLRRARNKERIESHEAVHHRKDGSEIFVSLTLSPIYDQLGDLNGVSVIARDISIKKAAEKRVSEFYSTVSHELRTPLTSIRASLGLMEGGMAGALSDKSKQLVHIARTESDRLIRLINEMLDLRKLEAGKLGLQLQAHKSLELVESTIGGIKGMADAADVSIATNGEFDRNIDCDRDRFIQVLTNLLSNAIKFSPAGSKVEVCGQVNANTMRFSVIDKGPGIAQDQTSKLFGKFQQLDSSDTRSKGGTGLGLAISKGIVEEHGGTIGFDSEFGNGSTFWFEMPLAHE